MNAGESTEVPTDDVLTRLRFGADGLMHRIVIKSQEAIASVRDAAIKAMAGRGPDDFVNEDDERIMVPVSVFERLTRPQSPRFNNGDGDDSDIKKWHLALAAAGLMTVVIGATWALSSQITQQTGKIDNLGTQLTAVQRHQESQDERISRIEQQLQQQANERRP